MFYEPKKGHPFSIDPYKSLIFPRPIGWISTVSKKGIPNLAPYSYFNAVADYPPQVMFSEEAPILYSRYKDSLTNILSTKEFVVNFATSKTSKQMALSSIDAPSEVDEFKFILPDLIYFSILVFSFLKMQICLLLHLVTSYLKSLFC